jgi:8-oxo-dGTP pyrophosphatase MutT (NUDIX family)
MFDDVVELLLEEAIKYKASVAVVEYKDKWLLGLAKTSDDRNNKWCFIGGGIKRNETPKQAVVRESREEAGIRVRTIGDPIPDKKKKNVAFFHCKMVSSQELKHNNEFAAMAFFTIKEMESLKLYYNVKDLIGKIKC